MLGFVIMDVDFCQQKFNHFCLLEAEFITSSSVVNGV
jgi:hypothetical protein